jgi:hypothetical protein
MKEKKKNCWEYQQCGREPGGKNLDEAGVCPAATDERFDGINNGKNSGRFCWAVAGTLCKGKVQGTFAKKFMDWLKCPFYLIVEREEDSSFVLTEKRINKKNFF